jgi:hypothetical protein
MPPLPSDAEPRPPEDFAPLLATIDGWLKLRKAPRDTRARELAAMSRL